MMLTCCEKISPFKVIELYEEIETELRVSKKDEKERIKALQYRLAKVKCGCCGHVGFIKLYAAKHGFPDGKHPKGYVEALQN